MQVEGNDNTSSVSLVRGRGVYTLEQTANARQTVISVSSSIQAATTRSGGSVGFWFLDERGGRDVENRRIVLCRPSYFR